MKFKVSFFFVFYLYINTANSQSYQYDSLSRLIKFIYPNGTTVYFKYDQNGNKINTLFSSSQICPGLKGTLVAETYNPSHSYQWQVDSGNNFVNIPNDSTYSGTTQNVITINNPSTKSYGYKFRCAINNGVLTTHSQTDTLKFVSVWYGGKDSVWENPANWGCNKVPDQFTDVELYGNAVYLPIISSNQAVRSLKGFEQSSLKVKNGYNLKIAFPPANLESVTIGNQIWTKKNLDVVTYRNGDLIPRVSSPIEWANLTTGAWCYYDNDTANGLLYGKLYNWYAINDSRGLAPIGWHIASDLEWNQLSGFFGVIGAGGKLKTTYLWNSPNVGATNQSGFSGLPGGMKNATNSFSGLNQFGYWWSSTPYSLTTSMFRGLSTFHDNLYIDSISKSCGFAVRCLKD